jgi:hypothetical protein
MSRVLREIKAQLTGERLPPSLSLVMAEDDFFYQAGFGKEYRIDVRLGGITQLKEPTDEYITYAKKNMRRRIAEEIFGEFRKPLLEIIQRFLESGDSRGAAKATHILENMFSEEPK